MSQTQSPLDLASAAMHDLSVALLHWLNSAPVRIRRAADLERLLDLDNPTAWRIFRVAHAESPADAAAHLPTINQFRNTIHKGASILDPQCTRDALSAVDAFEQTAVRLGGDQAGFTSLLSATSPTGIEHIERAHRRAAFKANAHLWGLRVNHSIATLIFAPTAQAPSTVQPVLIRGYMNIVATRPTTDIVIGQNVLLRKTDQPGPATPPTGAQIVHEFSTVHAIESTLIPGKPGSERQSVRFRSIGHSSAETLVTATLFPRMPMPVGEDPVFANHVITNPSEWGIVELIAPAGITDPSTAVSRCFASRYDPLMHSGEQRPEDERPIFESIERTVNVAAAPPIKNVANWPEIVRHVMATTGAILPRMDVYRIAVQFPMMHAQIGLKVWPRK